MSERGYLGSYHQHECPECRQETTGTGATLCPRCAWRHYHDVVKQTKIEMKQRQSLDKPFTRIGCKSQGY